MIKKAIIEILLVPESSCEKPAEIEREILKELHSDFLRIPWARRVEKVKVVER